MGLIICEEHGRQAIQLVCSHIHNSVINNRQISFCREVKEVICEDIVLGHYYCLDCSSLLNFPEDCTVYFENDLEAERALGSSSAVCGKCFHNSIKLLI